MVQEDQAFRELRPQPASQAVIAVWRRVQVPLTLGKSKVNTFKAGEIAQQLKARPASILKTHMVARSHLWLQIQGIWYPLPASTGTRLTYDIPIYMQTEHTPLMMMTTVNGLKGDMQLHKLSTVMSVCNPSTWEVWVRGSGAQIHPQRHSQRGTGEILSASKQTTQRNLDSASERTRKLPP